MSKGINEEESFLTKEWFLPLADDGIATHRTVSNLHTVHVMGDDKYTNKLLTTETHINLFQDQSNLKCYLMPMCNNKMINYTVVMNKIYLTFSIVHVGWIYNYTFKSSLESA